MASHGPSPLFLRLIHWIYSTNSGLAHFLSHRVKPAGILLIILIPISWTLMPLYSLSPVYQIRSLIFVTLVISGLWIFFRRAKVKIVRSLPRLATAGETLHYRVKLQNVGKKALAGANLLEMSPDNRPGLELFEQSREPGEEQRNIFDRLFCYYRWEWLQKKLVLFDNKPSSFPERLKPGEEASIKLSLTPKKRGVITLKDMRICLPDPFGIFQRCRKTKSGRDKLIVLPHRYNLPLLNLSGSARFQLGGEALSNTIGQSGDFTSVRDYRPGDPLRHIHWKSWARTGKPIVKEYEEVFYPRYGLVLDTFATAEQADLFEEAVSIAASFAASIDGSDTLLDLMFIRGEAFTVRSGRGEERVDKMLEVLAGVGSEPNTDFKALQQLVMKYHDELTACICVFTGWCEQRRDTVSRLHRSGMALKIISVCRTLDEAEDLCQLYPSPVPVHWIRASHAQQDLMMNLF